MIFRYLCLLLFITSCKKVSESNYQQNQPIKEELKNDYVSKLHDRNLSEVNINRDFVNILSVKHNIPDSICERIIIDYLDLVNNESRNYTNQYKVEAIKNYAFENNLQENQVANLLSDYVSYRNSNNN